MNNLLDRSASNPGNSTIPHTVASDQDIPVDLQTQFWNSWNGIFLDDARGPISQRQAQIILDWLRASGRTNLKILEIGCGTGWMARRLLPFGEVTGIDLADTVLETAQRNCPEVRFLPGDVMKMNLQSGSFDVIVTLEVLSHVADQSAFMQRIAQLLKRGGLLMIATQNRPVLARSENVAPIAVGQIRNWVDRHGLRALLNERFHIDEMFSICPHGHLGILRLVNSVALNRAISSLVPTHKIDAFKERLWLGHTLMARAHLRD